MPQHYNPLIRVKKGLRNNGKALSLEEVNRTLGIKRNNNSLRGKTKKSSRNNINSIKHMQLNPSYRINKNRDNEPFVELNENGVFTANPTYGIARNRTPRRKKIYLNGGDPYMNKTLSNAKSHLHKIGKEKLRAQNSLRFRLHPTKFLNKYKKNNNTDNNSSNNNN